MFSGIISQEIDRLCHLGIQHIELMVNNFYRNSQLSQFIRHTQLIFQLLLLLHIPISQQIIIDFKIQILNMVQKSRKFLFSLIFHLFPGCQHHINSLFKIFPGFRHLRDTCLYLFFKQTDKSILFFTEQTVKFTGYGIKTFSACNNVSIDSFHFSPVSFLIISLQILNIETLTHLCDFLFTFLH